MSRPRLAIVGPTCTGKTRLAVELAELLSPAELVIADSRQVLRGLRVGTCAPTDPELRGVRCHLLDLFEPGSRFSVHDWLGHARTVVDDLEARGVAPIVVGGTGLYMNALVYGFDLAGTPPDSEMRERRERGAAGVD